ncbi:hypothetical protein ABZT26_35265 [Streptomyces sp. NPDC005395]|uniref:hypothetical protein n=1 Tax=Streptomyces sp. NPDC005395 TaxID=3157042 RepID=UPI00339E70F5
MSTLSPSRPTPLAPTGDPVPVELAVVDGISEGYPPETFLTVNVHRPDGGVKLYYAWTAGGKPLGDRIDQLAVASGLDAADWLHIGDRQKDVFHRGRIKVEAYALRPILADVQGGERSPEQRRAGLHRVVAAAAESPRQRPPKSHLAWLGFGPALVQLRP